MLWNLVCLVALLVACYCLYRHRLDSDRYTTSSFKTVTFQALHYFARPHQYVSSAHTFEPLNDNRNAWNGTYMSQHPEIWTDVLTSENQATLVRAVAFYETRNKSLDKLTINYFPLTEDLLAKFDKWRYELGPNGRGFQVIKGVPLDAWNLEQTRIFYWAFGRYLGIPGAQDNSNELIGNVKDIGANADTERQYKTNAHIAYHCDAADVVGLLCLHPAKSGGQSRIVSSVSVYNKLLSLPKGQEYVRRLMHPVHLDTRGTGGSNSVQVIPIRRDSSGVVRTFWHQEYYRTVYRYHDVPPLDDELREALEAYDNILDERDGVVTGYILDSKNEDGGNDGEYENRNSVGDDDVCIDSAGESSDDKLPVHKHPEQQDQQRMCAQPQPHLYLDMNLERGDIQLISNHFVLHSRTEFLDYTDDEIMCSGFGCGNSDGGSGTGCGSGCGESDNSTGGGDVSEKNSCVAADDNSDQSKITSQNQGFISVSEGSGESNTGKHRSNNHCDNHSNKQQKGKRHLLRLWVSLNEPHTSWDRYLSTKWEFLRYVNSYATSKLRSYFSYYI